MSTLKSVHHQARRAHQFQLVPRRQRAVQVPRLRHRQAVQVHRQVVQR